MKYKLSQYNIFFTRKSGHFLWNTFSNALIKVDDEAKEYISGFNGEEDDSTYFLLLRENGCIVEEDFDELGKVLLDEKTMTLGSTPSSLYLTIAPGLGCNYECDYCFENKRVSHMKMTLKTQDDLYNYIKTVVETNRYLKKVSVTWFGGEPLLYIDIIYSLSKRFIALCDSVGIKYYAGMITNGRFLTPQNVKKLKECRMGHIQISIDGMSDNYTRVKKALPGDFAQTIKNVKNAAESLPLAIRINVFDTIEEAVKLTDFLLNSNKLDGKIKVYIAHTRDYDKHLTSKQEQSSHALFLDNESKYISFFGKGGKYNKNSFEYRIPKRRGTSCLSVCKSNLCIGPEGELYQCEHHYGIPQKQIGSLANGFFYNSLFSKYMEFKHYNKCLICKFFPVCLGGCIDDFVNNRNMIHCGKYRLRLIDLIMYEYEH